MRLYVLNHHNEKVERVCMSEEAISNFKAEIWCRDQPMQI